MNNRNVTKHTITFPRVTVGGTTHNGFTAVQNYTYDSLNRLDDAAEYIDANQTPSWRQDFSYDRYGNRNFDEANTTFTGFEKLCSNGTELCAELRKIMNPSVNTSDNRLRSSDDYAFDTSGNTTEDAQGRTFIYDAENKQVEVRDAQQNIIGQYRYDGDGRRIKKHVPSTGEVTVFVYDAAGKSIAEYSTQISQDPKVSYTTSDHLGSPRILTDENGTVISRRDFHPFGEEIVTPQRVQGLGYQPDDVRQKFTSYQRDHETELDYAKARMFGSSVGRFTSPDDFLNDTHVSDPQSWNLYVYVRNNPLRFIDPTGEEIVKENGKVKFDEDGRVLNNVEFARKSRTVVNKEGKEEVRRVSVTGGFKLGNIYSKNNGNEVAIPAAQSMGALKVTETDEKGKVTFEGTVSEYEKYSGDSQFNGANNTSNCHGTTFANGEVWIANAQVIELMAAEGYDIENPNSTASKGAVGIFSVDGTLKDPRHSVMVVDAEPTSVKSKSGIYPVQTTTLANAWDQKNQKLLYYTKRATR